ncbi:hypothetical protein M2306_001173 [Myroides gitamensis]|uniref:hypothetical protein n=1 Tax=Myroides odoratus TaxID=256 RepID=UPI0021670E93|nr:hypothetical protein [Myroides odoratus]MCS4238588.1 hypothetical protein [Myroides odoratus]MDH6600479.1 hypothetical protein [Myroides gitamensis]
MKQKLFLLFVLFIVGGSIGISKVAVDRVSSTEKIEIDGNTRLYFIFVRDTWNNDLLIYREEVCGVNNAFDRADVLLEQFNVIYQENRINITLSPTNQECQP